MDEITLTYLAKNELHEVTNRQGGLNSAHVKSSVKAISHSEGMKKKEFSKEDHEEGYRLNKAAQHHATKVGEHQLATIHQTLAAHHAKAAGIDLSKEEKKDAPAPKTEDGATVKKPRMHISDAVKHINSIKDKKDPKEYVEFTADTKEKKARPYKMHFHVEQGIKGKGMGYKPEDHGLIHGHDATADGGKGGYRQVKTSNIRSIKKDGVDHDVVHDTHEEIEESYWTDSKTALKMSKEGKDSDDPSFHKKMYSVHQAFGNKTNKKVGVRAHLIKDGHEEHMKWAAHHAKMLNQLEPEESDATTSALSEELDLKLKAAKTLFESIEFLPLEEKMHQDVSGFKTQKDGKEPKDAENFHVSDIPEKKKEFKGSHSYHASEKAFAASSEIGSTKNHAHAADLHRKAAKASKDAGLHDLAKHHEGIASVHDKLAASSPKSSGQQAYDRHQASKAWGNHKNPRAEAARAKGVGKDLVKARTPAKDSDPENYGSARRPAVMAAKSAAAKKQKSSGFDMSAHKQRAAGLLKSIGAHVSGITTAIKSAVGGKKLATAEGLEEGYRGEGNSVSKKADQENSYEAHRTAYNHHFSKVGDVKGMRLSPSAANRHNYHLDKAAYHKKKMEELKGVKEQHTLIAPVCATPETFFDRMGQKIAEGMDGEKAWQESIEEVVIDAHKTSSKNKALLNKIGRNQKKDVKYPYAGKGSEMHQTAKDAEAASNTSIGGTSAKLHQAAVKAHSIAAEHAKSEGNKDAEKYHTHQAKSHQTWADLHSNDRKERKEARAAGHTFAYGRGAHIDDVMKKTAESIHPNHFPLLSEFAVEVNTVEAHEEACKAAIKVNNKDAAVYHKKAALRTAIKEDTIEVANALAEAAVCSNGFSLLTQPKKFAGYHDGLTNVKKEKHKVAFDTKDKDGKRNMKEIISLVSGSIQEEVVVKSDLVPVQEEPLRMEMGNKENGGESSNPKPSKTTYSHNYGVAHFASLKAGRTKNTADHKYAAEMHTRAMNSAKSDSDKKYHQEKIADHNKIASATSEQVKEVYSGPASPQRRAASSKAGKAAAMKKYMIEPVTVKPTIPAKGQK